MKLSDLPEIDFVTADKTVVESQIINLYEQVTGRTLAQGDPVRLFILVIANVIILLLNKIDYTGKQNLLSYATGEKLDHVAALTGASRLEASAATVTMQFTLSASQTGGTVIPAGTRVSAGDTNYFALDSDLTIAAGETTGTGKCTCLTAGTGGNGYAIGQMTTLVDPLPYVASVTNLTVSAGGSAEETDDSFRERVHELPESFSCAGPGGAYEYYAKTANSDIAAVTVISPAPGDVYVYPLLTGGGIPEQEVLDQVSSILNDRTIRPLTDHVYVKTPTTVTYNVNIKYYIYAEDSGSAKSIQAKVVQAVEDYKTWQRGKIGRDVNPSKLIQMVVAAGAKRVEVTEPAFLHVKNGSEADGYAVELAVPGTTSISQGGAEDE
ncbi:baseplate J/gp47 family protein [uncultured Acidaminococcus sp.]|uniref:baseplate assembly protein n=1 Tax=uncultured Acidaminococcus sp. TaxID=352152 RepID=UPI0026DAD783|nr:baseplate J/gp47 family protein [uncultured Acidaminococcus sp.]